MANAIDYQGQPVVAAWSYLPSYRWGMVVKQDDGEAFALIYRQIFVVGVLLAATFLIVTAGALWLARTITRPIRDAAFVSERVAAGDLQRHRATPERPARSDRCSRPSAK